MKAHLGDGVIFDSIKGTTYSKSSSKEEQTDAPYSCLYASSIYIIQGWLDLHHKWPAGYSSIYIIGQLYLSCTVHTTKN